MEYLLIALLASLGWHLGKTILKIFEESFVKYVIYPRVVRSRLFKMLEPREKKEKPKKTENERYCKTEIGFR